MQCKGFLLAISLGVMAFLPVAHADYVNEQEFNSNGQVAQILESAIESYLLPFEVQQIGNALYNAPENFGTNWGGTTPSSSPQNDFVTSHMSNYCSPSISLEKTNFNCQGAQKDATTNMILELADVRPSALLEPLTYNQTTWWGAHDYIRALTTPFPSLTFANFISAPNTFNGSANQKRAFAAYLANNALMGVARYSLDQIFGMRVTGSTIGGSAASGNAGSQSILEVMENEATRRFTDPNYTVFLTAQTTQQIDLLREIAAMTSFDLWMSYHSYRQNERIAALLSAILASNASTALTGTIAQVNSGVAVQ